VSHKRTSSTELSIVVVAYDMDRELPRTVRSLTRPYQRDIASCPYEVIVADNGSPSPVDKEMIEAIAPEVRVVRFDDAAVSPAAVVNRVVAETDSPTVGIVLDGARLVTPGVIARARQALAIDDAAFVTTLAWHLGPDHQTRSALTGYNQATEDGLLARIEWPADGYRLFEVAALAGANPDGWFGPINESCCMFMSRDRYHSVGGLDESFTSPGGGYLNLDFFTRSLERHGDAVTVLLGEGSFHQIHGGVASNATDPADVGQSFAAEYESIRGHPYHHPRVDLVYFGHMPPSAVRWISPHSDGPDPALQ
jgi:glycosyltransferase involved in cell wall biosynthesis